MEVEICILWHRDGFEKGALPLPKRGLDPFPTEKIFQNVIMIGLIWFLF